MVSNSADFYQAGGSLPPQAPTYVARAADQELYELLLKGKFCFVLTARQMGKSSLRVQVSKRLQERDIQSINIDLTNIGSLDTSADQWYYSLLSRTCRDLEIPLSELRVWWKDHLELSTVNRFSSFIEEILLPRTDRPLVIFIDEIDYILSLDRTAFSTDDFFAVIRHCYNSRADTPEYARLTFCLLGVATPNDLMQDPARTPFNIGHSVELDFFSNDSAKPLLEGLSRLQISADRLLEKIIAWTGGQPYLTQKLCHELVAVSTTLSSVADVDEIVERLFLSEESEDHNIKNVNNRILLNEKYNLSMLELVQQLYNGDLVESDDKDYSQIYLKLSGLVRASQGHLVIANKIYEKVFDTKWLAGAMAKIKRPFIDDMRRWLDLGKPKSVALRGEVLTQAIDWPNERTDLTPTEYEYLNFSRMVLQEEQAKELELRYTGQLRSRNRFLLFTLIIVFLVGISAIYFAIEASKQAEIAEKRQQDAEAAQEMAQQQAKIAKVNEEKAISNLRTLKGALVNLDQTEECRLGVVEYLHEDKELYQSLLSITTPDAIEQLFKNLRESISTRELTTREDFASKFRQTPGKTMPSELVGLETIAKKFELPKDLIDKHAYLINAFARNTSLSPEHFAYMEAKKVENLPFIDKSKLLEVLADNLGRKTSIPDEIKKNHFELTVMVLNSESMNDQERDYWFNHDDR